MHKLVWEFSHQKFRYQVMTQNDYDTPDKKVLLDMDLPNQNHPTTGHFSVITND